MRKNGVNRELREIKGGVCAPGVFRANGIHCGLKQGEEPDLAMIVADKRCPTACVFSVDSRQSAPVCVSRKHLKNGVARAIVANSGIANVFLPNGEQLAEKVCRTVAKYTDIDACETLIASTGRVGRSLSLQPFEEGIPALCQGLSASEEGSWKAACAIVTTDAEPKQLAYEFDLGDIPCKIGAIFKGNTRVCPNMATLLAFLTTNVNISSEMLQKALSATVKDTFDLLWLDGISSPNDTVCIMANGRAGNYKISCADSEYVKFVYALREVLTEICRRIVADGNEENSAFLCKVTGARSKQSAREIAKRVVGAEIIKKMLLQGESDVESVLYTVHSVASEIDFSKIRICLENGSGSLVLFEDGRTLPTKKEHLQRFTEGKELCLCVELGAGNYAATAFGRFPE